MKTYDAILVLGLKLKEDGKPEQALLDRVVLAAKLYQEGLSGLIIPCGGQTENTPISEAKVMTDTLLNLGVPEEHIHPEDQSLYTVENIRNARAIMQDMGKQKPRVILVTSDYHAFRAAYMARSMGLKVKNKPSKTPNDALKKQRRKMEFFYFINYAMGWETGKRKRPAWYDKGVKWLQK